MNVRDVGTSQKREEQRYCARRLFSSAEVRIQQTRMENGLPCTTPVGEQERRYGSDDEWVNPVRRHPEWFGQRELRGRRGFGRNLQTGTEIGKVTRAIR